MSSIEFITGASQCRPYLVTAACICFPHEYELIEAQALAAMEKLNEFGPTSSCRAKHALLHKDKQIVTILTLSWNFGPELSGLSYI